DLPSDAGDTFAIVSHRSDHTRHQRAVTKVIEGIVRAGQCIPTVAAVNRINPDIRDQVFVSVTHSGIRDRHYHITARGQYAPAFRSVDVRVWCAAVLARVVQSPQCAVEILRVVWRKRGMHFKVWLGEFEQPALLTAPDENAGGFSRWNSQHLQSSNSF